MSAPDSPAHFHALLQLRGRTAAWPAAAAAAAGRAYRTVAGLTHGCREPAQGKGCTVRGH